MSCLAESWLLNMERFLHKEYNSTGSLSSERAINIVFNYFPSCVHAFLFSNALQIKRQKKCIYICYLVALFIPTYVPDAQNWSSVVKRNQSVLSRILSLAMLTVQTHVSPTVFRGLQEPQTVQGGWQGYSMLPLPKRCLAQFCLSCWILILPSQ